MLKRVKRIQGKRIEVFIDTEKWNVNSYLKELEHAIEKNKRLGVIYEIHKKQGEDKIKSLMVDMVFDNFFKATEYFISHIQFDLLHIYVKIQSIGGPKAFFDQIISRENFAFFTVSPIALLQEIYVKYFKIPNDLIIQLSHELAPIEKVINHEFVHFLDINKVKEGSKIFERYKKIGKFDKWFNTLSQPFDFLAQLRVEGLAKFVENKNEPSIEYNLAMIKFGKEWIVKGDLNYVDRYQSGMYMWYFISLSYLLKTNKSKFDEMRAYFGKDDFLFFAEGLNNILTKDIRKINLQNLSENFIMEILKEGLKWSHLHFLKEYESACYILKIPKDQILMTVSDYNRIKKIQYNEWLSEVEKKGFKISRLSIYFQRLFSFIRKS